MRAPWRDIFSLLLAGTILAESPAKPDPEKKAGEGGQIENWQFLDNGKIRLGINMSAGGAIGWFSGSRADNMLNTYDQGRYVQQSFYGDADGSDWNGKPWCYNPVQGGSWRNEPAQVLEQEAQDGRLWTKTQPRQWASGTLVTDMVFEQELQLTGSLARLGFTMRYTGTKSHAARHQELPAVFVQPRFSTLVFCPHKAKPWVDAPLERQQPGFPNQMIQTCERWVAWEAADGQALGIYFPHTDQATVYRVTNGNVGDCSYVAPVRTLALQPGLKVSHETVLALGTVADLRARFRKLAATAPHLESREPHKD
jgi:hypothetical protein